MEYTTTPLNDRIADLRPADSPPAGDVRRRTDHSLNVAYELLLDHRDGAQSPMLVHRAAENVGEAIATLTHYQERLLRLSD